MRIISKKTAAGSAGLLAGLAMLAPVAAMAAPSSFSSDLWRFASGNGASIIDFNKGASGIWDNGDLHVATDNFMILAAGQRVTVSNALALDNGPLLVANIAQVGKLNSVGDVNAGGDVNVTGVVNGDVLGSLTGDVTGNVTGNTTGVHTGAVTGNASTATALAANPADCAANTFATTIVASGALTCAAVADAGVADDITLNTTSVITGSAGATVTGAVDFSGATSLKIAKGVGLAAAGNCAIVADQGKVYYATTTAGAMTSGGAYVCVSDANADGTQTDFAWELLNTL